MRKEIMSPRSLRLETVSIVVAIGALMYACGCVETAVAPAATALTLAPEGPAGWEDQVTEATIGWNEALGCEAFAVDFDGSLTVRFYPSAEWEGGDTVRGLYTSSGISIRETTREIEHATLMHELGHALGAPHLDVRNAVMYPIVGANHVPTEGDIAAVRPGC